MVRVGGVAVLLIAAWAGPARAEVQAASEPGTERATTTAGERRPAIASFEGRSIDLSEDWEEARACLVWRHGGILECFRTPQALDARIAQLSPERDRRQASPGAQDSETMYVASSYSCSSSLRLFDYNYYGGRQLSFWDRGYWQNLGDYGFDDRTSSYAVGGCYAHLAEHPWGGGWWYPGPTYPYAGEPVMSSSWQNIISSIYIE
ncbi:MAG TPA: hypothetical protein VHF27_06055 [Acidimicrobiales bacterium]|nr:hypothetical protein [Acidimicrobiales bacterium]